MIGVGTLKVSEKAKQYVNEVLNTDRLSYGPFTQKFESKFAAAHGCRFAVMSNSGTSALMVALAALKEKYSWQDGDEVIVPAVTFIATSNIVLQNNMRPVFVDVEPDFYELDPTKLEAAIGPKTRCIIPVHLFGCPCDMDPIMEIAKKHDLKLIEDSCESMFVSYKGQRVGSFGDIGCFSTYIAHLLTTGVGGLCTTSNPELAIAVRSMINHGRDSIYLSIDDDKNKSKEELNLIVKNRFSFIRMGYSYRVTELEGAIGLAEFEDHEAMMATRKANARYLDTILKPYEDRLQLPRVRDDSEHAYMMYPLVLRDEKKASLVRYVEEQGIETREMMPLINQPFYQDLFNIREADFPHAKWINESGFYIGAHQGIGTAELDYMGEVFASYFNRKNYAKQKTALVVMSKLTRSNPTYIEKFYDALPRASFDDFILVDYSVDDSTANFFRDRDFKLVSGKEGKGAALQEAVSKTSCENIVVLGIDGSDHLDDLPKILIKLLSGSELVIASRFLSEGARRGRRSFSFHSLGNRFFTFLLNIIYNSNLTDCNNLFRGFKRQTFESLNVKDRGDSVMFEMSLNAVRQGLRISEVPTIEDKSVLMSPKRNRVKGGLDFLRIMFTR